MAFVLYFKTYLNLFLLSICLPLIASINSTQIQCNYEKFGLIGCPEESHLICNNETNFCHCNQSSDYRISFGDIQCLPERNIDQKCFTSDQCSKTAKNQLFCYFLGTNQQKLTKLDTKLALDLKQRLNKTIEGFCRCDDHYYYDYEENQCIYQNPDQDITPFLEEFFCKQCPIIDANSHCNQKLQTCDCNHGFIKNSFGKCVPQRHLFERCGHSDQCVVANSYCEPNVGQCLCEYGFYRDFNKNLCVEGRHIHEKCAIHQECAYQYGYCEPSTSKCLCDPSVSIDFNMQCVKRTPYGHTCHDKYPDLVCELSLPHTLCSKYTERCVCENGFLFMSNECQKININRFAFGDDFRHMDDNRNPMTYILIFFSAIFGVTIIASILIKMFRRPDPRLPRLALYDTNRTSDRPNGYTRESRGPPTAPPDYSESRLRESSQTLRSNSSDNEDKPPSYEEAISGHYSLSH